MTSGYRSKPSSAASSWSNRVLLLAVAGICFLTLFPFQFSSHRHLPLNFNSPFLLGVDGKGTKLRDVFLNVLLFVPFGFGLAEKLRERGMFRLRTFVIVFAAGAAFSYTIEFLQIFIPTRDSGWEDVFTNSTGAACGCLLFYAVGATLVEFFALLERRIRDRLTPVWAIALLLIYFAIWFAASTRLQANSRLSNWDQGAILAVGNDPSGAPADAWKGSVFAAQFWDMAMPPRAIQQLHLGPLAVAQQLPIASYAFSGAPPFHDQEKSLPTLLSVPAIPSLSSEKAQSPPSGRGFQLQGENWLASEGPISPLIKKLEATSQFTIRIVCASGSRGVDGRILVISRPAGTVNVLVSQDDGELSFWFRNPLTANRSTLVFRAPHVFDFPVPRDLVFSYDGSTLLFYLDGKLVSSGYILGPGTSIVERFYSVKPIELRATVLWYYSLVFFPGGVLLGLAASRRTLKSLTVAAVFLLILMPVVLELILVGASHRAFSPADLPLSAAFGAIGMLWINTDPSTKAVQKSKLTTPAVLA